MNIPRLALRLSLLGLLTAPLSGCLAAVGTVAGVAVGVTAKGVGMAASAVIPDGDDEKEDKRR
jgi:hypothetical protein